MGFHLNKLLNKILYHNKKGNTLSETLIALVIVGVVFTISMGTIVADYNKNQTVVRLKKMYSVFNQAFDRAIAQDGMPESWDFSEGLSERGSYSFFEHYLKPYLIISRDCKNSIEGTCAYTFKELDATEKALNSTWARFFLNDGTFVALQTNASDTYKVVYFYIDTNGKKRLNVVARDIFLFEYWIQNDAHPDYVGKLLPFGHEYSRSEVISTSNPNNCNSTKNGNYCASLIMIDNWQIIRGYPWAQARYVVQ